MPIAIICFAYWNVKQQDATEVALDVKSLMYIIFANKWLLEQASFDGWSHGIKPATRNQWCMKLIQDHIHL